MVKIERWKVQRQMQRVGIRAFKDLAKRADIAPQTLSRIFGGAGFSSEMLSTFCNVLECDPGDILTRNPIQVAPTVEPERVREPA